MRSPFPIANRRLVGAAVLSCLLLVPLGLFGGSALAHNGGPSAAQYQYKVTICHRTHSKKPQHQWVLITIGHSALAAHLRHGDKMPPCPTTSAASPKHNHGKPTTAGQSPTQKGGHDDNDGNEGNQSSSGHGPPSGHDNGHHGKS